MSIPLGAQWCLLGLLVCSTLASGLALDVRDVRFRQTPLEETAFLGSFEPSLPEPGTASPLGEKLGSLPFRDAPEAIDQEQEAALLASTGRKSDEEGVYVWIEDTFQFGIGSALVLISVSALWLFERHKARVDCLFWTARSSCESISGFKAQADNSGRLVHVTGAQTRPIASVRDPRFEVVMLQEGCVRLRTEVQVYQSVERPPSESWPPGAGKAALSGGGAWEGWSEVDLGTFSQDALRRSAAPPGLRVGTSVTNCGHVELGTKFTLPDALVDQCRRFQPADHLLESSVTTRDGQLSFRKHEDGYFYCRHGARGWTPAQVAEAPRVGDARVRFEHVAPGPVTVMALQAEPDGGGGERLAFAPFRLVSRGVCGLSEKQERAAQLTASKKSREQLAGEDQCLPGSRLCCGCNLVARCFTGVLTPEIFKLFEGTRTAEDCFQDLIPPVGWTPWVVRLVAYLVLATGFSLIAFAVVVAAPFLKTLPLTFVLGGWARLCYCLFATLLASAAIVFSAYIAFRPVLAFSYLLGVLAVILIPNFMAMATGASIVLLQPSSDRNVSESSHPSALFDHAVFGFHLSPRR